MYFSERPQVLSPLPQRARRAPVPPKPPPPKPQRIVEMRTKTCMLALSMWMRLVYDVALVLAHLLAEPRCVRLRVVPQKPTAALACNFLERLYLPMILYGHKSVGRSVSR